MQEGNEVTVEYYDNIKHELGRIPLLGLTRSVLVLTSHAHELQFQYRCLFLVPVKTERDKSEKATSHTYSVSRDRV
jgi:hypothetical protein